MAGTKKKAMETKKLAAILACVAGVMLVAAFVLGWQYYSGVSAPVGPSKSDSPGPGYNPSSAEKMQAAVAGDTFFEGISVDGIDLSGMTYDAALSAVQAADDAFLQSISISIQAGDQVFTLSGTDFSVTSDAEAVLTRAYALGRTGILDERYACVMDLKDNPQAFSVTRTAGLIDAQTLLDNISVQTNVEPVNAQVGGLDDEGNFVIVPEVTGLQVDTQALLNDIESALAANNYTVQLSASMIESLPQITQEYLENNYQLMTSFSTTAKKDSSRNTNIELALASFNNFCVAPGEEFSFNNTTGERTVEKGYQSAGVILGGASAEDIGGGVCQVSGTLFNAVVRAGLEVTVRSPHSYPSDYIKAGMDAMVNWPDSDFRFKNTTEGNIYLITSFDWKTRKLTVSIYGIPIYDEGVTVDLRSEQYEFLPEPDPSITYSDSLAAGEVNVTRNGRSGSRWHTYRQFFDSEGNLLSEELLCSSTYRALSTKITIGTNQNMSPSGQTTTGFTPV